MRIAMIGQKGIPAISGGIERHVEEIGKRLVAQGHDLTVYCREHYAGKYEDNYKGIKLKYLPSINKKSLDAISHTFVSSLNTVLNQYDIIHYHAIGPATLSFIPRMAGKKVVVTVHGLDWMRDKWGKIAKTYLKLGEKSSILFPNETIVVSKTLREYFKGKDKKNVCYIPNGIIKPTCEKAEEIKKWGLERESYILFLARLVPEKGCHHLIKAYENIGTDKKLVIAGDSSNSSDYVEELHRHRSENVIFTGQVKGKLLNELYTNAYLYVLPSEIEGLPISLLEAMSFGKCCLVSDIPENLEVIQKDRCDTYGYSFKNKDCCDLSNKLNYLLNNKNIVDNVKDKASEMVIQNYNWDKITQQTIELYQKVIECS